MLINGPSTKKLGDEMYSGWETGKKSSLILFPPVYSTSTQNGTPAQVVKKGQQNNVVLLHHYTFVSTDNRNVPGRKLFSFCSFIYFRDGEAVSVLIWRTSIFVSSLSLHVSTKRERTNQTFRLHCSSFHPHAVLMIAVSSVFSYFDTKAKKRCKIDERTWNCPHHIVQNRGNC